MKKTVFAVLALSISGYAMAQSVVTGVQGVATIIDAAGKTLQTVNIGMTIPEGSTLSTTGSVTVQVANGQCSATLSSGQTMAVTLAACQEFVARANAASSTVAGGAGAVFTPLNIALGVGGLGLLNEVTKKNKPISPN